MFSSPQRLIAAARLCQNDQPTNSGLDTLLQATGWDNPSRAILNGLNKATSLVSAFSPLPLLNPVAAYCFRFYDRHNGDQDTKGYDSMYSLDCIGDQTSYLTTLINNTCGEIYQSQCHMPRWAEHRNYGSGYFSGSACNLRSYDFDLDRLARWHCTNGIVYKNVRKEYGTNSDIIITTAIVGAGVTALTLAGIGLFKWHKRNLLAKQAKELSKDDDTFSELFTLLKEFDAGDNEKLNTLKKEFQAFQDDYTCGIELMIMSQPVTLGCQHSFQMSGIQGTVAAGGP
jgi:hypothetical protein